MKKPIPFGKYLLLERVNVGGMAEVFKAKAFGVEGFERLVALKRILPSIAEDTEFITMFIDEAKIAVQLTHANIAQIFDLGKVGDSYFIAMEYVQGRDLRAIFDRARKRGEPLPVPMACYVTMKVCEGLDYAHNKRDPAGRDLHLVHRDVSPQNVLLSHDGEVKIIDFGIAKAAGKAGKTQAGILKGKFGYMSPEQVRGLPLDRRSDVFAVGICLYEVLTGERLFVGESDFSTLEKVRNVEIMPPSTYNRRIPEELEQIVLKALAKDVDDRYQTAMDLHDDLQSFMYTSGNFFARKDLSAYMRKGFAEEIAKESARDERYQSLEMPRGSGLDAFDGLPAANKRAANVSAPARMPKRTMMGMGAVPPPPPGGRVSVPGARPPPPPPRTSGPPPLRTSAPAPAPAANLGGPSLDMDWDDEELSTQIYDKPEAMAAMNASAQAAGPTMPDPMQARPSNAAGPRPPASAPPAAGPPAQPARRQTAPTMQTPGPRGAPSPFDPGTTGPTPGPRLPAKQRREPTAVTRTGKDARGPLAAVVGAFVVLLFAGVGAAIWFGVFAGDPGTIQLTTTPPDPVVRFDEQPVPATSSPFVIPNVEVGTIHLLEVHKTGYRPWSMQVEVQSGQTLVLPPVALQREGGEDATPAVAGATPAPSGTGFSLTSEPSGAKVFIDGAEIEQRTPVTLGELSVGSHTIRVENGARYAPWETQVDVRADTMIPLTADLELARITVSFASEPSGANVTLIRGEQRRNVGRTPTSADVDLIGEGAWEVELELSGHEAVVRPITPVAGEDELDITITLERRQVASARAPRVTPRSPVRPTPTPTPTPRPVMRDPAPAATGNGTLRVNTRPWSQVFVDGQLIGNTPQMNIPLSAGSHRLTLVNSDFNIRETVSVQVRAGETTTKIITLTPGG